MEPAAPPATAAPQATAVAPASASAAPRGQLAAEANVVPGSCWSLEEWEWGWIPLVKLRGILPGTWRYMEVKPCSAWKNPMMEETPNRGVFTMFTHTKPMIG